MDIKRIENAKNNFMPPNWITSVKWTNSLKDTDNRKSHKEKYIS